MHTRPRLTLLLLIFAGVLLTTSACDDDGGEGNDTDTTQTGDTTQPGDTSPPGDTAEPGDTTEPGDTADAGDTGEPGDTADASDVADAGDAQDVPEDTTGDTTPDTIQDTTPDTDMGGGGDGPWPSCPDASAYVGDTSWPLEIEVVDEALFCGLANEGFFDWETMEVLWSEQLAHRAQMWVAPGTYQLPDTAGTYPFTLPLCFAVGAPDAERVLDGTGELTMTVNTFSGTTYYDYVYRQAVVSTGGSSESPAQFELRFSGEAPAAGVTQLFTIDGSPNDPFGETGWYTSASLCEPDCQTGLYRGLDSCHFEGFPLRRHNLTFDGGAVELDLRYGVSAASTEPGQFLRASGTLDGTAFDNATYWELGYTPAHHHFERNFLALFDAPIGQVCALAAEHLDEWDMSVPEVRLLDCNLDEIETRKVTGNEFTRIDP